MAVDGLAELAVIVETVRCGCPVNRRSMPHRDLNPPGWHDPPSIADWESEMAEDDVDDPMQISWGNPHIPDLFALDD